MKVLNWHKLFTSSRRFLNVRDCFSLIYKRSVVFTRNKYIFFFLKWCLQSVKVICSYEVCVNIIHDIKSYNVSSNVEQPSDRFANERLSWNRNVVCKYCETNISDTMSPVHILCLIADINTATLATSIDLTHMVINLL